MLHRRDIQRWTLRLPLTPALPLTPSRTPTLPPAPALAHVMSHDDSREDGPHSIELAEQLRLDLLHVTEGQRDIETSASLGQQRLGDDFARADRR